MTPLDKLIEDIERVVANERARQQAQELGRKAAATTLEASDLVDAVEVWLRGRK